MILKKINRSELVSLLEKTVDTVKSDNYKVIIPFRKKGLWSIVKVEEESNGVFLCPAPKGDPMLKLLAFVGSEMRELSLSEIVEKLKSCSHEDVWIGWSDDNPHIVPGHAFGIGSSSEATVFIVPVPKDIDDVNERLRKICAKKCKAAERGLLCVECCGMMHCDVLGEAEKELEKIIEG